MLRRSLAIPMAAKALGSDALSEWLVHPSGMFPAINRSLVACHLHRPGANGLSCFSGTFSSANIVAPMMAASAAVAAFVEKPLRSAGGRSPDSPRTC